MANLNSAKAIIGVIFTNTDLQNLLAKSIGEALRQGAMLLGEMTHEIYVAGGTQGTVGGHFRHCLEFVNCFLEGIAAGRVDYDGRARNYLVETQREYARAEYWQAIRALEEFLLPEAGNNILVKPEDLACDEDFWCASSIERELEFLRSHTIHHYALINFKLRAMNFPVPPEFGVAPSTLRFWKREKSAAG